MDITSWVEVFKASFYSVWVELVGFLPKLVVALAVLVIGWFIARALFRLVVSLFGMLKLDNVLRATGFTELFERSGHQLRPGHFIGFLVKWFVIIVFVVATLEILNLDQVSMFFRDVVLSYLPKVIVAVLILFGSMVIANVVDRAVVAAARTSQLGSPELLGRVARYAIIAFAVLAILSQLQIAERLVEILFAGIVFGASLAFGLAFGFGGRDTASRMLDSMGKR